MLLAPSRTPVLDLFSLFRKLYLKRRLDAGGSRRDYPDPSRERIERMASSTIFSATFFEFTR
jgi:hypothetical protein